jgi:zinc/manganese transport system substrate-binding protein
MVTSMIEGPGQDPHAYQASARTQLALSKAQVVLANGGGYDDFVGTMLASTGTRPTVLDAVELSGHRAPAGGELNEHVWYDLPTVAAVADRLAQVLSAQRPDRAAVFSANAAAFTGRLTALEATEAEVRASAGGAGVATTEPVPVYLLQACGLEVRTPAAFADSVEEGSDASPASLRATEDLFRRHRVRALVYNDQTAGPQTQLVVAAARASGVPVVPVTETLPRGQDYLSWMASTLARVRAAVTG